MNRNFIDIYAIVLRNPGVRVRVVNCKSSDQLYLHFFCRLDTAYPFNMTIPIARSPYDKQTH